MFSVKPVQKIVVYKENSVAFLYKLVSLCLVLSIYAQLALCGGNLLNNGLKEIQWTFLKLYFITSAKKSEYSDSIKSTSIFYEFYSLVFKPINSNSFLEQYRSLL